LPGVRNVNDPATDAAAFWNRRYNEPELAYGDNPNDFLRQQAETLPPGDALCLADGQGRNAVFLARLGHRVTAQDLSPVGLRCAQELARRHHVNLTTDCSDLASFAPEPASVDLVVAIWMQLPTPLRAQVHEMAIAALRPGGLLILEAYTRDQLGLGTGGPPSLALLVDPVDLRQELSGLQLALFNVCRRHIDEGPYHQGESAVVQVVGRKP